jgi:hypothetical protein
MTSRGMTLIYNGGLSQQGNGIMDWVTKGKKAHDYVKGNKLISKSASALSALGLDKFLDSKTKGLYSKGVSAAKKQGYGRKRKRAPRKKR